MQSEATDEQVRRRRWIPAVAGALALVTVVTVAWLARSSGTSSTDRSADAEMPITVESGSYTWGVYLGADVRFDSDRGLDDGYFEAGSARYPVQFWTVATDCDCEYPDPLPAHAGEKVIIEATSAIPDCTVEPAGSVTLVVTSRMPDGHAEVDRLEVANPEAYADAVHEWCAKPVSLMLAQSYVEPGGHASVAIRATNPGPDKIVVETPAVDVGSVHWGATHTMVPGGESVDIPFSGEGVHCNTAILPWTDGQLTVDGKPVPFPGGSQWC